MKYKFDTTILENNLQELITLKQTNQERYHAKFAEIENTLYTDMRKHYNDLKDYYTYEVACSDYHDIMNSIVEYSRESDRELNKLLQDYTNKINTQLH
jgi:hypothetical protein